MKALLISLALLTTATSASADDWIQSKDCGDLYHKGWYNMQFGEQIYYMLYCKPYGWE